MQLTHIDISVPRGTLSDDFVSGLEQLLCGVLGWRGGVSTTSRPGSEPSPSANYRGESMALTLHEADEGLRPGVEDHLGFMVDLGELDRLAAACAELAARDARFETLYLTDGVADSVDTGAGEFHTFFVRFGLPVWFQFEHYAAKK